MKWKRYPKTIENQTYLVKPDIFGLTTVSVAVSSEALKPYGLGVNTNSTHQSTPVTFSIGLIFKLI